MRQFLIFVVPLILPTLLYYFYLVARQGHRETMAADLPWSWLAGAGALLLAVTLGATSVMDRHAPGAKYIPPTVVDGVVVPGHFEDAPVPAGSSE
jgi:hypothetical protein